MEATQQKKWKRGGPARPVDLRFWEKVDKNGPTPEYAPTLGPCWLWTGYRDKTGYGRFGVAAGNIPTSHRYAYETTVGAVPAGMHLDHLCRVRACCRPEHLEVVTHRENLLRGETVAAASAAATHCPQGHPYDDANTYVMPNGNRTCRACRNAQARRRYVRRADR